jgi:hypothetical protein
METGQRADKLGRRPDPATIEGGLLAHKDIEPRWDVSIMSNKKLNDDCILFVDHILNADENDRTREEIRSIRPEALEKEGRFRIPCCEYLVEYIDKFEEVYDGHIGLGFCADGDDYFEDFSNCPFCGAPISYSVRKTFKMVPEKTAGRWVKQEVSE